MMVFSLNTKKNSRSKIHTIEVRGDVVGRDSERFKKAMDDLIDEKCNGINLDLQQVNFMDSPGLGVLTYYHMWLKERSKTLKVTISHPTLLSDLFEKTKLDQALEVEVAERL